MLERVVLVAAWLVGIGLIFGFPKQRIRLAHTAFLFKQLITWVLGVAVVEAGWIEYPVREFASVNRSSFTYEYFLLPVVCAFYNARYPGKSSLTVKFAYLMLFSTILTVVEVVIEAYTDLIQYVHWTWYWTFLSLTATFLLSRLFCVWYFRLLHREHPILAQEEKNLP